MKQNNTITEEQISDCAVYPTKVFSYLKIGHAFIIELHFLQSKFESWNNVSKVLCYVFTIRSAILKLCQKHSSLGSTEYYTVLNKRTPKN